ncbi:MAG: homocysteine S-methyltransferase family protein [Oscillospiraceae bacterium]|nr:homocysteine S-methyltransferase family protein [Oscillospiraceae bacterium]
MLFDSYGKYIYLDGAMGTMLQRFGAVPGSNLNLMNITAPETVENIHAMFIEAGSDIIYTNTFSANALNLEKTDYSPREIISAAVKIARRAAAGARGSAADGSPVGAPAQKNEQTPQRLPILVALDIGPIGQILEPAGDLPPEKAYELYAQMAEAGERENADLAVIETMSDIEELKIAMKAVSENTKLPIMTTMTFEPHGYTYMGCTPEAFAKTAEELGAIAVGLNCSLEPTQMYDIARRIADVTRLPLIIKPNAGLPDAVSGRYKTGAKEFAEQMLPYSKIGARIVGGCCGTDPEYIKALRELYEL